MFVGEFDGSCISYSKAKKQKPGRVPNRNNFELLVASSWCLYEKQQKHLTSLSNPSCSALREVCH